MCIQYVLLLLLFFMFEMFSFKMVDVILTHDGTFHRMLTSIDSIVESWTFCFCFFKLVICVPRFLTCSMVEKEPFL